MVCASSIIVGILVVILAVAAMMLLFYRFYFLRKPVRSIPKGDTLVSPANGKVVRIIEIGNKKKTGLKLKKGLLGRINLVTKDTIKKGYVIVIMMTPFDVHYQRSPVDGTILNTKYKRGRFLNAMKDAAGMEALENEKNEITIRNPKIGKVKVVQIAGFLARRIRCFVRPKQKVHKGKDIGLICLGSQVILVIPKLKLNIKEGQKVTDGETVIARLKK